MLACPQPLTPAGIETKPRVYVRGFCFCAATMSTARKERLMADNQPMTAEQAVTLKRLAELAYELEAFKRNLTGTEAHRRIAALTAKLKLLSEPPHTQ